MKPLQNEPETLPHFALSSPITPEKNRLAYFSVLNAKSRVYPVLIALMC